MDPQVAAAVIAGALTLIGTLAAQVLGRRATRRDLAGQRDQLTEQRKQLDRTLDEQRTRTLNERFATAAGQLGSDKPPEVRLAGVYAMAGLADDWPENRQTCVDVLCGYLRMPYEPDPGDDARGAERLAFRASREVRHTVIRVITAHLRDGAAVSWQGRDFDFTGIVFDGGDFAGAVFSGGKVYFTGAEFSDGDVDFRGARFSGSTVNFAGAEFSAGTVNFTGAEFSDGDVDFRGAKFSGGRFSSGRIDFLGAAFSGSVVSFDRAEFSGSTVRFSEARFSDGEISFFNAEFSRGMVDFINTEFSGGLVNFTDTGFSGGMVRFSEAKFSGGRVTFPLARFSGGEVDFTYPRDWSVPPHFSWRGAPPPGVELPRKEDQSQA
jgi:uncharacterized protein YjbI with pentapeptide repeats